MTSSSSLILGLSFFFSCSMCDFGFLLFNTCFFMLQSNIPRNGSEIRDSYFYFVSFFDEVSIAMMYDRFNWLSLGSASSEFRYYCMSFFLQTSNFNSYYACDDQLINIAPLSLLVLTLRADLNRLTHPVTVLIIDFSLNRTTCTSCRHLQFHFLFEKTYHVYRCICHSSSALWHTRMSF